MDLCNHFSSEYLPLGPPCLRVFVDLPISLASECNGKDAQDKAVGGFNLSEALDQGDALFEHLHQLVAHDFAAIEVGLAGLALDVLDYELEALAGLLLRGLQVAQVRFEHASLQGCR